MVLCIIALPIFAVLSIFSIRYRRLTKDALDCLFKTVTLRKCRSGLDDRIKASLSGKALKFSPKLASFIYNRYKLISWAILIIFLWSLYVSSVGIYNYVKYGNCNGPEEVGFCILDPTGANSKISEADVDQQTEVLYPVIEEDDPIIGDKNAQLTIIEFGCYACPYTKKAEPIVKEVLEHYNGKVNLQFKTFYIPHHKFSYEATLASDCAREQGTYEKFHAFIFKQQENLSEEFFSTLPNRLGINIKQFDGCMETEKYKSEVDSDNLMGLHAGVKGTPTFFINKQVIVGPKPFRTFTTIIDEELK